MSRLESKPFSLSRASIIASLIRSINYVARVSSRARHITIQVFVGHGTYARTEDVGEVGGESSSLHEFGNNNRLGRGFTVEPQNKQSRNIRARWLCLHAVSALVLSLLPPSR